MPEVLPNLTYTVKLTANEFKLVCRALAGLVGEGEEDAQAKALNVALVKSRAAYVADLNKSAQGVLEQALGGGEST